MSGHQRPDGHRPPDSLDLLAEQDRALAAIFEGWDRTAPDTADGPEVVELDYDHGTYGKLLIEHAAVRVAAKADIERVLRAQGLDALADQLTAHLREVRDLLDRLDEMARGVAPIGVGGSLEFAGVAGTLAGTIRADLRNEPVGLIPKIAVALGPARGHLRSAKWVGSHAPTHPGSTQRWFDDIPILARVHARYDHLRGYPWADSSPFGELGIAARYDSLP